MKTFKGIRPSISSIAANAQFHLGNLQIYHFMHSIDHENDSVLFYIKEDKEGDFFLSVKRLFSKFSPYCIVECGMDSDGDCWIELKLHK